MRAPIVIHATFISLLALRTHAATYSTPINDFADDASGKFAAGTFDFGFAFSKIDSITVESSSPIDIEGGDYGGSVYSSWSTGVVLFDVGEQPLFPASFSYYWWHLFGEFHYVHWGGSPSAAIWPLNPPLVLNSPAITPEWPAFLFEGHGAAAVQLKSVWGCVLNCTGSGTDESAAVGIAPLRLIVEGTAVPEPCALQLLPLIALSTRWLRRVRHVSFSS